MKLDWKTFKVVFAFVIIAGIVFWAMDSVRTQTYSGTNLAFGVGSGPVTLTNASDEPVSVQLVGPGTRTFSVVSSIEGVEGSSTREGVGGSATQVFVFDLPSGESEFRLTRGSDISFVGNANTSLEATVQPIDAGQSQTIFIVAAVVILGLLYYISATLEHGWISMIRSRGNSQEVTRPVATVSMDGGQGQAIKAYGDNRSEA